MIWVSVTNVGKVPTTIKLLSLHGFETKRQMRKRNGKKVSIVTQPLYTQLPIRLNPGDDRGGGLSQNTEGIDVYIKFEHFIIQVEDTMSHKPFRPEVDKALIKQLPSKSNARLK